jgi:hypothetical protein
MLHRSLIIVILLAFLQCVVSKGDDAANESKNQSPPDKRYLYGFKTISGEVSESEYGMIDKSGNIIFQPQFLDLFYCPEDKLIVRNKDGWKSVVFSKDNWILKPLPCPCKAADYVLYIGEGYYSVLLYDKSQLFIYDSNGNLKSIYPKDTYVSLFAEGLAPIRLDNRYGYLDNNLHMAINPLFEVALPFSEGRAAVRIYDKFGFIDQKGKLAVPPIHPLVGAYFRNGLVAVSKTDVEDPKKEEYIFIRADGVQAFDRLCSSASRFSEGLAAMRDTYSRLVGFIDTTGKYVIKPDYISAGDFTEGIAPVLFKRKPVQDNQLNPTNPEPDSKTIYSVSEGMDGGYIDKQNKVVFKFSNVTRLGTFWHDLAPIHMHGYEAYINKNGTIVFKTEKETLICPSDSFAAP